MLDLYTATHKATKQQIENKNLFSDIAIGVFREKNRQGHSGPPTKGWWPKLPQRPPP